MQGVQHHAGRLRQRAIGMIETALPEFDAQHIAGPGVEHAHWHGPLPDEFAQRQDVFVRRGEVGVNVESREDRLTDGILLVFGRMMLGGKPLNGQACPLTT